MCECRRGWQLSRSRCASRSQLAEPLPHDSGAAGVWQKIRKLQTTASLLHTTAHPDDEHGGMLAMMSRGQGARTALLTLTRGESGDNAIGSELFDALGLIRTEELLVANRYYGVDEQYFTSVADYGFSKRLDEALDNWNREATLAEVVRIIRMERPLVIVSRFRARARRPRPASGRGPADAGGLRGRGRSRSVPEQFEEGLRPWQALKLFVGGRPRTSGRVRSTPASTIRCSATRIRPSRARPQLPALAEQRPLRAAARTFDGLLQRLASVVDAPAKETGFFDGIDTTIPGMYGRCGGRPHRARPRSWQRSIAKSAAPSRHSR